MIDAVDCRQAEDAEDIDRREEDSRRVLSFKTELPIQGARDKNNVPAEGDQFGKLILPSF